MDRTPVKTPAHVQRRPVAIVPVRKPVPRGGVAATGFIGHPESDSGLAVRIQAKIDALGGVAELVDPQALRGLGQLFDTDRPIEDLTDEELDRLANYSVSNPGADPMWDQLTYQMLRSSVSFMAQELLTGPPEEPYNGKFLVGNHHIEWDELLHKHSRLCILAPRDHGKTFFFDFAYPIWQAIRMPKGSGFIFSASQTQAERILDDIRVELETNPKLQWLVPDKRDRWGATRIRLADGHTIYARGFGTRVRGAHPDWIVVDDGLNDETAYSETVRQKQKDYFFTAISNMLVPGGQLVVIGTPFHSLDLYAELKENTQYHFAAFPAESAPGKPDNKALWPERYSLESLEKKKEEIKSIRYTREFLVQPVSDDMSLFPMHLFQGADVEQFNLELGMPKEYWTEAGITPYMGVDFAMSSNVQADFTVAWVIGVDKLGNRWLIDMERAKGLPYQQQLSLINTLGKKYEPGLIYLESNQMQRIFGDELIRTSDLPIKQFVTGAQKHSLDKGVPSLRILLENKKFRIPRGSAETIKKIDIWISEMQSITWIDGKIQSVAGHDDTVMALWICDQAIRAGGFQFTFGDEAEYKGSTPESRAALYRELTGEAQPGQVDAEPKQTISLV